MRTIAHISDLHFGAADPLIVEALASCLVRLAPHVVAVSGDLTQRARRWQFLAARTFLEKVPRPQIVVPGNHDVPLYDVVSRFCTPRRRFRAYITGDPHPQHVDDEIAVLGADTTRSFTIKDGGLRRSDVRHLSGVLAGLDPSLVKIVVCHHPFDPPASRSARLTTPAADAAAVDTLIARGADVFLTGHLHLSYAGHTATRYHASGRTAIVVEAGTATSTRARGEGNAFHLLHVDRLRIVVDRWSWNPHRRDFLAGESASFERAESGWQGIASTANPPAAQGSA